MKQYNIFRQYYHPQYALPAKEDDLWVFDWSVRDTFYQDCDIQDVVFDKGSTRKFAWINESYDIDPTPYNLLLLKFDEYIKHFDMIFTHHGDIVDMHDKVKWIPASQTYIKNPSICDKTKLVSMISSNKNLTPQHAIRIGWMNRLKNQVDMFGHGINPIDQKEDGLCDYMFSVAIENSSYKSYFTEKILDCFATGTIPIYMGCPNIGDFFNMDGIILLDGSFDVNSLTPELYYSKMEAVKDNFERCKEYLSVDDYIQKYVTGEKNECKRIY